MIDVSKLRKHQREALGLTQKILEGKRQKTMVFSVTPGGGKTRLASVVAQTLFDGKRIDHVAILCPRDSLRTQVADGFAAPDMGLTLRIAPEGNKSLGQGHLISRHHGYVTTYQAVSQNAKRHLRRMKGSRMLLVLDEPHHLSDAEHAAWKQAVEPLVTAAEFVVLMSGTLRRDDGSKIAFVPYDEETRQAQVDVRYTRRDALDEHAILPVAFKLCDGESVYEHLHQSHATTLSGASKKEEGRALKTALLSEEYRTRVIDEAMGDFLGYRATVYKSRAIVLCHSQAVARQVARQIRETHKLEVSLAISDEKKSQRTIRRFREGHEGDVLVTVGMAYEGLDVPDCTHLVCLTDIRSEPWLEQAFARVTRVDHACGLAWGQQLAFIYVPDDPRMRAFLDTILNDQEESFRDQKPSDAIGARKGFNTFRPSGAEPTQIGFATLEGRMSDQDNRALEKLGQVFPKTSHWPLPERLQMIAALGWKHEATSGGADAR
jgi:superfamily II DNA or RNA helicase